MPNRVKNDLHISGPKKVVKEIVKEITDEKGDVSLNKIRPMPKNIYRGNLGSAEKEKYGENNWYDWSIKNWGTKWDTCETYKNIEVLDDVNIDDEEQIEVYFSFDTAWSTPYRAFEYYFNNKIKGIKEPVELNIDFADEDIGSNYGYITITPKEILATIEHLGEREGIEFACEIWGFDAEEIIKEREEYDNKEED